MGGLATRMWPSSGRTSLQPKGSRLDSGHARPKLGTDFRREVLLENELRFPAPCRGDRGSLSGETTGQVALLKTLGRHCAAPTMCVRAMDVNITWHRLHVKMQETSTSHSIVDYLQSLQIQCNTGETTPRRRCSKLKASGRHRAAPTVCKRKACQHHVASTMCANALRDVNIA